MDKNNIIEIISDMQQTIDALITYIDNVDVLKFYAGKMSVLSKELLSSIRDI